jgi:hypothetical protein
MGKSVLYYGSQNLLDLGLRYIQRHSLSDNAKSSLLIRLCCLWLRNYMGDVLVEAYPKILIAKPTTYGEYWRRVAAIQYGLEWYMYQKQPTNLRTLFILLNFDPSKT